MSGENVNRHASNYRRNESEGVRRRGLTEDEVYAYVLTAMGFPNVDVETSREQLRIFWQKTLDVYNTYLPHQKRGVLDIQAQAHEYDFEQLNKAYGRGVVDVRLAPRRDFFSPISGVFALGIPHPISPLSPDQYDLALRYIDMAKRVYSAGFDWEWHEPVLWVFAPPGYGGPYIAAYTYFVEATEANDIPSHDIRWIKDYMLNIVRIAVGEARGKFGIVPGPSQANLNGSELIQRGEAQIEKLEEELRMRSFALTPPLGPGARASG